MILRRGKPAGGGRFARISWLVLLKIGGDALVLNPSFKKFISPQHLVDPLAVISAAGDFMGGATMPHIFHRAAQYFQTPVKHFTLYKAGSAVIVAMKNDIWRGDLLHIIDR